MQLPRSHNLPVNKISACFNNTSATYKYYWFLSIIQSVENGNTTIQKRELFARMIANAWYTVNFFHVSFGKQDLIQEAIQKINTIEGIPVDEKYDSILKQLIATKNVSTIKLLNHFDKNVPHWFLSPWFPGMSRNDIYQHATRFDNNCLYSLLDNSIDINNEWLTYLNENAGLLKAFCYWHLALFLQAKNPNVPDIPNKLIKPAVRKNLTQQRTIFWDVVLNEVGSVTCIYTGNELTVGNYAVEHFIPYNFVSHDLMWNLIPADKVFNNSKSDKLPRLERYFDNFFAMQKQAIDIIREKSPKNKFLEDYLTIFADLDELKNLPHNFTSIKFKERIQPLITIASNNGFEFLS